MQQTPVRRMLAGLAVAGAVIGMGSAPAFAAPAPDITFFLADATTPVGAAGVQIAPTFWSNEEVTVEDPSITFELADGLTGVSLAPDEDSIGDCETVSPTKLTCTDPFPLQIYPGGTSGFFGAFVKADDSATVGDTGEVTATFSAKGVDAVTQTAKVRVAEAVDLTAIASPPAEAAPGESFDGTYGVSNSGDKPVNGVAALIFNDWGFEAAEQYRNCRYFPEREVQFCEFDETLEPGSTYQATMAYKVRADTYAPGGEYGEILWLTPEELEDFMAYVAKFGIELGEKGTGGTLELTEAPARKAMRAPQADAHPEDNWGYVEVTVTGKNGVDLAAVGSEVTGKVGDEVTATAGVRNVGTATLDRSRSGSAAAVTAVYAPEGTSFVAIPEVCAEVEGRDDKVECFTDYIFFAGQEETYEFVLQIDKVVPNAKGVVAVNEPCECDNFQNDINKANNNAAILVNKTAGGGTGGGDGGDDPTLPITGPAGMSIAIGGLVLLGLGVGALMVARRRTVFRS